MIGFRMWRFALFAGLGCGAGVDDASDRLAPGRIGVAASQAGTTVWSERGLGDRSSVLWVHEGGEPSVLVDDDGNPDRPGLSPEGGRVAYVSAATGLASVWVVRVATKERLQLTNVGLRAGNGRPEHWVPPPDNADWRFDGNALSWTSAMGPTSVELPVDWR